MCGKCVYLNLSHGTWFMKDGLGPTCRRMQKGPETFTPTETRSHRRSLLYFSLKPLKTRINTNFLEKKEIIQISAEINEVEER